MGTWTGTNLDEFSRNDSTFPSEALRSFVLGPGDQNAEGNDSVFGLGGNDVLEGYGGGDLIEGGSGNDDIYGNNQLFNAFTDTDKAAKFPSPIDGDDSLYGQDGNDRIWGQEGSDRLFGQNGNDRLFGGDGNDTLVGGADIDTLSGEAGNDALNGGVGADLMRGGAGDDTYGVDDVGDVVDELGGSGIDTVHSSITFNLANAAAVKGVVEKLVLSGTLAINGFGNGLNNVMAGNSAANRMEGKEGNDIIRGWDGNDTLLGGGGNDTLFGGLGNDTLVGGPGADRMRGEAGNDVYEVNSAGDVVDETGGSGSDTVHSSITFSLANTTAVKGAVEKLVLSGALAINGTGNALANAITGNTAGNVLNGGAANDTLRGQGGNDTLIGGAGIDTLFGGPNNDIFVFNASLSSANRDVIADFSNAAGNNDTFHLENLVMPGLGAAGPLKSTAFFAGAAAHDADDRIIYNQATGALFYDTNGNAAGGTVQLATLTTKPTITFSDFVVI
jgi:serralysin